MPVDKCTRNDRIRKSIFNCQCNNSVRNRLWILKSFGESLLGNGVFPSSPSITSWVIYGLWRRKWTSKDGAIWQTSLTKWSILVSWIVGEPIIMNLLMWCGKGKKKSPMKYSYPECVTQICRCYYTIHSIFHEAKNILKTKFFASMSFNDCIIILYSCIWHSVK